ncbi:MAG TPA: beta-ketoacyl-[acyl-carrier-protein] synthase family protein [Burkholderiales bacterium]|jgi:3-oxoacyl-[acyl-carrier-protein] synthase II|nr:beta-ketoacyl-[acyl-carrier-protein] synthase family protein [Burkholderiales bacterium]
MGVRRVAITGAGVVSPLGASLQEFHQALAEARSGIRRLPQEIAQGSGVQVGALVDWNPAPALTAAEAANIDRVSQFALAAAAEALASSGLDLASADRTRIGVYWGTGMGGAHTLEASYKHVYGAGEWRTRPLTVVMAMNNAAGSNVAVRHALGGPFANFSTACSSSAMALGEAMRTIAAGRADAIVAGGSEALLTPASLLAWQALRTLAPADPEDPAASCKPFDKRRLGLVLGEGGAALVLEDEAHARARGARIHGFLTGYGNSCDAVHMSRPDRGGQMRAMREALDESGLAPADIGYVNAHATATAVGDVIEAQAINAVFGAAAAEVRVSSTKSLHGHLLGAAGALEFAAALLALEEGLVPPTAFLEQPDPAFELRHVALKAERIAPPRAVMSNSFGFGGSNVVLVASRA